MRLIARKEKFVCALLTVILSGGSSLLLYSRTMNPKRCLQATSSAEAGHDGHGNRSAIWFSRYWARHRFNELISVRPEVRYEYAFSARPCADKPIGNYHVRSC
jgi:hypothetical protein